MAVSDDEVMQFLQRNTRGPWPTASKLADLKSNTHHCELLFRLVICRNIILSATHKIRAMETASYCGTRISILVLDDTRKNVARLVPIYCYKIRALASAFEKCLEYVIRSPEDGWESRLVSESGKVTLDCLSMLSQLGLAASVEDISNTWFSAVLVLDTSILSYVGAHLEHFDGRMHGQVVLPSMGTRPSQHFPMPSSRSHNSVFQDAQSQWTGVQITSFQRGNSRWGSAPTRIVFEKRSFSCLDDFLHHKTAWVCRNRPIDGGKLVESFGGQPSLFLSTDAESFADIWGPMWSSHHKDHPDQIVHYNVGNGMILPWEESGKSEKSQEKTRQSERLGDIREEKLCHWISDTDAQEESNLLGAAWIYLSPGDRLLIGAGQKLEVNPSCKTSSATVKELLRDIGVLHRAGTIKKTRYRESETVQTQVGWSGIGIGIQANYKIRERNWKEVIIETWKNDPRRRVPRILEFWLGVEVSMCTRNARRQRLIILLGSDTMQTYLKSLSLEWADPQCEIEFYAALSNPDYTAFRTLWDSHVDWRSDLGAAIGCCLDALATTGGIDGDLQALWVPEAASECIVTLSRHEHSWTQFLKDTRDSCTLAVFNVTCLQHPGIPKKNFASSCQSSRFTSQSRLELLPLKSQSSLQDADPLEGRTLLETSIIINKEYLPNGISLNTYHRRDGSAGTYKQCWNVKTLALRQDFGFGEKGILEVIHTLGSTRVLTWWKFSSVHWMFKGKASCKHHHEFMGDEELDTRPLEVVIQSKSKVQNYKLLAQTSPREGAGTPTGSPLASIREGPSSVEEMQASSADGYDHSPSGRR
ncbi:hypothetical protein NA56DRAFT_430767 [Hyaloscypha hepaticicola]|uniref:Uncharacterized protein n=1 Tax=Hyaloscypha hepaticicola TaxID=2082293 RepID=A0A2J6QGB0_9HELO|nr:hypothetical protein NA56DRAFT_430767 [Hyaloscypha hepaticicola]